MPDDAEPTWTCHKCGAEHSVERLGCGCGSEGGMVLANVTEAPDDAEPA